MEWVAQLQASIRQDLQKIMKFGLKNGLIIRQNMDLDICSQTALLEFSLTITLRLYSILRECKLNCLLCKNFSNFDYIERRTSDKQDIISTHTLTDYPKELTKKVTLLQHFKSYLENDKNNTNNTNEEIKESDGKTGVYVKKWMKTRHAIMFRLSNKIVQVNFTDKTEIILSSENKMVTYVNKKGERSNYPLATALESNNTEMAKRLKYTKEILTHMLNNNANHHQQQQGNHEQGK